MSEYTSQIILGLFTLINGLWTAYLAYNQKTKDKITDYKIEKWKEQEKKRHATDAGNIAIIYGELWELLYFLKADRVYILQPHPLYKQMFISVTLEVKNYGISSAKGTLTDVRIDSIPKFVARLAKEDLIFIEDTETEDVETKAKALMMANGCKSLFIKRLLDDQNRWIGSIFLSYLKPFESYGVEKRLVERMTRTGSTAIQYILPEIKTE